MSKKESIKELSDIVLEDIRICDYKEKIKIKRVFEVRENRVIYKIYSYYMNPTEAEAEWHFLASFSDANDLLDYIEKMRE